MTNLGDFFTDLTKNIHNAETDRKVPQEQHNLLHGDHPLKFLQLNDEKSHNQAAKFLQELRSYTPSQKIMTLTSINPYGYGRGSQFIDPNYMWVGLG